MVCGGEGNVGHMGRVACVLLVCGSRQDARPAEEVDCAKVVGTHEESLRVRTARGVMRARARIVVCGVLEVMLIF